MSIKVMIVDDHVCVIQGLQYYLQTQPNIELVGEATCGEEAVEKIGELRPDVVLMDLIMPGMTGIEATRQIRSKHPNTKVIILTSFSDQDKKLAAIQAGANSYLFKDIQPDRLLQTIYGVYHEPTHFHSVKRQGISFPFINPETTSSLEEERMINKSTWCKEGYATSLRSGRIIKKLSD
ncbi:response regulator transcription factor [Brevibacillus sp. M2.1A]|uniref:response regulator n=1 Tax=Brevibacillus sp. M2.1A TaxID=2738980 RepID=UPI00156A94D9|nr:response regulator transcription factor [Brevibacillus sp. M2.1A]MCC8438559.1 response regulator transcription factor [Brevibacillus sp. M2.1A]